MCLGVPGAIESIYDERGVRMAVVDFGGATKAVCLVYAPEADLGDYVIVHAGFAIAVLDTEAAHAALAMWAAIDATVTPEHAGSNGTER